MLSIIMTLLVRDEEDVIVANLRHHLALGIDHVIVTDNLSRDRTPELLEPFVDAGLVTVITETDDDYDQAAWVTRMARLAADKGADWVINNDADEFWWPTRGDLHATLADVPADVGVLVAHRHDFVPLEGDSRDPLRDMTLRRTESLNAMGQPLPPKVAHRAHPKVEVAQGNHRVQAPELGTVVDDGRLEILHFPLRTFGQFERKIVQGGNAYTRNPNTRAGTTWRMLYDRHQQGRLHEYWDSQLLDVPPDQAVAAGVVVPDHRLRERLDRLGGRTSHTGPVVLRRHPDLQADRRVRRRLRAARLRAAATLRWSLGTARHVALVNYPDIDNVGDPALWLGTMRALRAIGVTVVHHASADTLDPDAIRSLPRCDAVLVNGGGNFGDLWPGQQQARERLLEALPDIPVVQLPQSMHFQEPANRDRVAGLLDRPGRTTLLWREARSLADARATLPGRHRYCPDLAFWLPRFTPPAPTVDVLWLARQDKESVVAPPAELPPRVRARDWTTPDPDEGCRVRRLMAQVTELRCEGAPVAEVERRLVELAQLRVARGRNILGQGAVVVTDRLHGHVLATLMGIPQVVLDNSYGKVSAVHDATTRGLPGIHAEAGPQEALARALRLASTSSSWSPAGT